MKDSGYLVGSSTGCVELIFEAGVGHDDTIVRICERQQLWEIPLVSMMVWVGVLRWDFRVWSIGSF